MSAPAQTAPEAPPAALFVLVALVALTPWPYGAVHPQAIRLIAAATLVTSLAIFATRARTGQRSAWPLPLWPLLALVALAAAQLLPLPEGLSRALAPGPARVWHPAEGAAAAVLGEGARPVSVFPEATRRALAFGIGLLSLGLLAVPALRRRRDAVRAVVFVLGGALLVAAYGIVARTLFGDKLYGVFAVPTIAPFGPFVSKNHFAGYVEMAALLAAGLGLGLADDARRDSGALSWSRGPRAGRVVAAFGAALAMTLALLVSQSRGGAVSLAAGALSFAVLRPALRRHGSKAHVVKAAIAFVVLAVGAVALLPPESRARLATLSGIGRESAGGGARLQVWGDSLRLFAQSPAVGHGFGAYADALPPVRTGLGFVRVEHAESDMFEALAEGGLVGLGLFATVIVLAARRIARGLRQQADRLRRGLGLGATTACIALLVHGLFDFNLHLPSNALLFVFCAVLALACATDGADDVVARWPAVAGAAFLGLVLAIHAATPAAPREELPPEARAFVAKRGRPVTPLRVAQADTALRTEVHRRPANAMAWLVLAWLRTQGGSPEDAAGLARHAAGLDPQRKPLQEEAKRIAEGR